MADDERPLRADARRNRDRLLEAAARAFARDGSEATLNGIAREAGVGIGTLFRHFATREELVEAVYRSELARLCDDVPALIETKGPEAALREWMDLFLDYMATKNGMADALRSIVVTGGELYVEARSRLTEAMTRLLDAGVADGRLRPGVEPWDVIASLGGVTLMAGMPEQREQAGRMLDLLMNGLRA